LQRAVTDFGADHAFGRVADKLKEHYGITLPPGMAAAITKRHAQAVSESARLPKPSTPIVPHTLITEVDGSMIPTVVIEERPDSPTDKRKCRTLQWKEAKLLLVRRPEEIEPAVAVTLGDAASAGQALRRLAEAAGLKRRTRIHGLGDGASWIVEQIELQFGT